MSLKKLVGIACITALLSGCVQQNVSPYPPADNPAPLEARLAVNEVLIDIDMSDLFESVCNKLYRRDLIDRLGLGFDTESAYLEDLRFNCTYVNHIESLWLTDSCYYVYRQDGSNSLSRRYVEDYLMIIEENIQLRHGLFYKVRGSLQERYQLFIEERDVKVDLNHGVTRRIWQAVNHTAQQESTMQITTISLAAATGLAVLVACAPVSMPEPSEGRAFFAQTGWAG